MFVEALNPSIKSNRTWWEMPSKEEQLEKQRYEQDVNYIPPSTWEHDEERQPTGQASGDKKADEDELDAAMEDYYYSAFDRRDEMEAEGSGTTSSNPVTTPKDDTHDEHTKEPGTAIKEADIFNDDEEDDLFEAAYRKHKADLTKKGDQEMTEKLQEDSGLFDLDTLEKPRQDDGLLDSEMADI